MKYIPKFQSGGSSQELFKGLDKFIGQPTYTVPEEIEENSGNCIGSVCKALKEIGVDIPIIPGNSTFWESAQKGKIPVKVYATTPEEVKANFKSLQRGDILGHDERGIFARNGYYPEHAQIVYDILKDENGNPKTVQVLDGFGDSYRIKSYEYEDLMSGGPYGNLFIGRPTRINGIDNPIELGGILKRPIAENIGETITTTSYPLDQNKTEGLSPFQLQTIKNITSIGSDVKKEFITQTGISNDRYDELVKLLVGISGQESNYGVTTSKEANKIFQYGLKSPIRAGYERVKDFGAKILKREGPSRGTLQVKDKNIFNYDPTNELVAKFGITKENYNPNDLRENTIMALALLDHIDVQQLPFFNDPKKSKERVFKGKQDNFIARAARSNYKTVTEDTANNPNLSYQEKMLYLYNRPRAVARGKAQGDNTYVNNTIDKSSVVYPQKYASLTLPVTDIVSYVNNLITTQPTQLAQNNNFDVPAYSYKIGGILKTQNETIITNNMKYTIKSEREQTKPLLLQRGNKLPALPLFDTNKAAFMDSVLNANSNLEWIQRLYPTKKKEEYIKGIIPGQRSTHLMANNGNGYVFPQIVKESDSLLYLPTTGLAEQYAREKNTGIQFKTPEQGAWFVDNLTKKPKASKLLY